MIKCILLSTNSLWKLYKLNSEPEASCCFGSIDVKNTSLSMWHLRYGHLGYDNHHNQIKAMTSCSTHKIDQHETDR